MCRTFRAVLSCGLLLAPWFSSSAADDPALALVFRHHEPLTLDVGQDGLVTPAARQLVTRSAYATTALLREHPDLRATVAVSSSLLYQIHSVYLVRLLPCLDRERNRIDARRFLERSAGRTDPWIDLALAPPGPVRDAALARVTESRWHPLAAPPGQFDRMPRLRALAGRPVQALTRSLSPVELAAWHLLAGLSAELLDREHRLANGSILDLRDLVEPAPGGGLRVTRRLDADDANRLVAETVKVLESYVLALGEQRLEPRSGRGSIALAVTPFFDPPVDAMIDLAPPGRGKQLVRDHVVAARALFAHAIGGSPDTLATLSGGGLTLASMEPGRAIVLELGRGGGSWRHDTATGAAVIRTQLALPERGGGSAPFHRVYRRIADPLERPATRSDTPVVVEVDVAAIQGGRDIEKLRRLLGELSRRQAAGRMMTATPRELVSGGDRRAARPAPAPSRAPPGVLLDEPSRAVLRRALGVAVSPRLLDLFAGDGTQRVRERRIVLARSLYGFVGKSGDWPTWTPPARRHDWRHALLEDASR